MSKTPRLGIEYGKFEFLKNKNFQVPTIFVLRKMSNLYETTFVLVY
jgi:hypothetical protein